jgi:hypothetical protein
MSSGNMPARIDHYHQDGADCQRRQPSSPGYDHATANGKHRKNVPMNSVIYWFMFWVLSHYSRRKMPKGGEEGAT